MGIFFVYILKSSVCLTIFYLFYKLLLSRDTFHRFNRIALLGILLLSQLIPFCEITVHGVEQLFFLLGQAIQVDGLAILQTQQIVGGDMKELSHGNNILGGGNGQPHFPGVDRRTGDTNFLGQRGLR